MNPGGGTEFRENGGQNLENAHLELLLNGAFSPLAGFMGQADYERVCTHMRLADGTLWPVPVTLDVPEALAARLTPGMDLALRNEGDVTLAVLHVQEVWSPDLRAEAQEVFASANPEHPGVNYLLSRSYPVYVGGRVEGIRLPVHYDYRELRLTPAELRGAFRGLGWRRVVAFQTRNPLHRAHVELTVRAARQVDAGILIHPVVGLTKPGDIDHYTRVRCYQVILPRYPEKAAMLSLLPLAMRMAGPREAVWHAIIRRNYGCSHLIVGRDHAGPGKDSSGKSFYGPYDAHELLKEYEREHGVAVVPFQEMVFVEEDGTYVTEDEMPDGATALSISGTELRDRLAQGGDVPEWFTYPEVLAELRRINAPPPNRGLTVFFTGLSGSGKSTVANVLVAKLLEMGARQVTLLDGDLVRRQLSADLGFSKEDRDTNVRRIGVAASEIAKNGGIAICAAIAPYHAVRGEVRRMIQPHGGFMLVHVATPLEVCEQRDHKGLYARARAGIIRQFTGISDPYEQPSDADLVIDTAQVTAEEAADRIISHLDKLGFLAVGNSQEREARSKPGSS